MRELAPAFGGAVRRALHTRKRGIIVKRKSARIAREGELITRDEMSYPDWRARLERATRELDEGKGIELEEYLRKRKKNRRSR